MSICIFAHCAALALGAGGPAEQPPAPADADWYLVMRRLGRESDASLGYAFTSGDWNGDGWDDLAVSSHRSSDRRGGVEVFYSGRIPPEQQIVPGAWGWGHSGYSVFGEEDVNGDGIDDLLIGAPFKNPPSGVQVHFGSPRGVSTLPNLLLYGALERDYFGYSVAAHDADGDGWHDIVVGADDGADEWAGAIWTFHGGPDLDPWPDQVVEGNPQVTSNLGSRLAPAGDLDGDQCDDLVVGDHDIFARHTNTRGRAFLILDGSRVRIEGPAPESWFSYALAAAGDWDLDGVPDFAFGAPRFHGGGRGLLGWVGVLHGVDPEPVIVDTLVGREKGGFFGASIAGGTDFSGDGIVDLAISAPGANDTKGTVAIFAGGPGATLQQLPLVKLHGTRPEASWGHTLAGGFDLDRDGRFELLIGAPDDDEAGHRAGAFEIWERSGLE